MNRWAWLAAYVGAIIAANWAIATFGVVPVGFGLLAPAGVYFTGLSFALRDGLQESAGARWVVVAITAGAGLSALISGSSLALASGVAFLLSELLDFAVYTPLRRRGLLLAVGSSNLVGVVADSVVFLALAFGSLEFLLGQVVGKMWVTLLVLVLIVGARRLFRSRSLAS